MLSEMPEIIDAKIIGEYLQISYEKSLQFIKYSGIPYLKLGNTYRLYRDSLTKWIQSSETKIFKV
jgi:excisionase family DNA binding protein